VHKKNAMYAGMMATPSKKEMTTPRQAAYHYRLPVRTSVNLVQEAIKVASSDYSFEDENEIIKVRRTPKFTAALKPSVMTNEKSPLKKTPLRQRQSEHEVEHGEFISFKKSSTLDEAFKNDEFVPDSSQEPPSFATARPASMNIYSEEERAFAFGKKEHITISPINQSNSSVGNRPGETSAIFTFQKTIVPIHESSMIQQREEDDNSDASKNLDEDSVLLEQFPQSPSPPPLPDSYSSNRLTSPFRSSLKLDSQMTPNRKSFIEKSNLPDIALLSPSRQQTMEEDSMIFSYGNEEQIGADMQEASFGKEDSQNEKQAEENQHGEQDYQQDTDELSRTPQEKAKHPRVYRKVHNDISHEGNFLKYPTIYYISIIAQMKPIQVTERVCVVASNHWNIGKMSVLSMADANLLLD
jgi:hypothetical protein